MNSVGIYAWAKGYRPQGIDYVDEARPENSDRDQIKEQVENGDGRTY